MNSNLEIPIQLVGKLETEIEMTGSIDINILQYREEDNEYGGKTVIIGG